MQRTGSWVLAAAIAAAVVYALWDASSVPDPITRGSRAPDFSLPLVPGDAALSLESLRGRVVLLNFWATWCEPCKDEMPAMQRLYEQLAPRGLELLAVSVDDTRPVIEQFQQQLALDFPILWDAEREVSVRYQAFRFPETLLIDRDGTVLERYIGPREWDDSAYAERIGALLDEDARG